jgi:ketosteroid isomerase-like protein
MSELQERFWQATGSWNNGDDSDFRAMFHDDAVWHAGGNNPASGRFEGVDDVVGWFTRMREVGVHVEPQDMLEDDGHFVFFIRIFGDRDGKSIDQVHANAWRHRDGKFTEGFFLVDDQEAWDAFLS